MNKIRLSLFLCTLGIVSATQMTCSSSLNKQLLRAVRAGDYAQVDTFLRAGANVNAVDDYGQTTLSLAVNGGYERVVEQLLQAGVDDATVLHLAIDEQIVKLLLREGADVHAVDVGGNTALHKAALGDSVSIMDQLLQAGADVNAVYVAGDTALHLAGNYAIAQRLVQAGADFEVLDGQQKSPLVRCANSSPWEEERNVAEVIGYLISVGAGTDDLLNSDELRGHLKPHVGMLKGRAEFLRTLLKDQGLYPVLEDLIGQYAGFPISKKAVGKMEARLLVNIAQYYSAPGPAITRGLCTLV